MTSNGKARSYSWFFSLLKPKKPRVHRSIGFAVHRQDLAMGTMESLAEVGGEVGPLIKTGLWMDVFNQ